MARTMQTVKPNGDSRSLAIPDNKGVTSEQPAEIPARELWLFHHQEALAMVLEGLEDSAQGRVRSLGSFRHYLNENND